MTRDRARGAGLAALALALVALAAPLEAVHAQSQIRGVVRNRGVAVEDAAVYLIPLDREATVTPDAPQTIDQVHLQFVPNVAMISPGTELSFMNSDGVLHNVFGPGLGGVDAFDLGTYDRNERRSWSFVQEGLHVVLCHIHPEMAAYIIVARTAHKALTRPDGTFELRDVPAGRYRLHAWHMRHWRNEYAEEVEVSSEGPIDIDISLGRSGDALEHTP